LKTIITMTNNLTDMFFDDSLYIGEWVIEIMSVKLYFKIIITTVNLFITIIIIIIILIMIIITTVTIIIIIRNC